jgi:hypothetical protein
MIPGWSSQLEVLAYLVLGTAVIAGLGGWLLKRFGPRK